MGTRVLPDMHTLIPQACGSQDLGVYIRQHTCAHVTYIKTHDSESRGQEETAIIRETKNTRPLSELFTRKSVYKTTNAVVKPP